ncbi:MAG: PEP/pyruvate-binding domain-containing protein, partial [Candidatus Diapherotrites archaeon]|nr:PEP/pyruvate-binding domain-containing protein [Candidatus Diapherotrites archaeon]
MWHSSNSANFPTLFFVFFSISLKKRASDVLAVAVVKKSEQLILWFDQLGIEDVPLVGGKNASLGEMYRLLTPKGVRIPNGFALTASAYRILLEKSGLKENIRHELSGLDTHNMKQLIEKGHNVRHLILKAELPKEIEHAVREAYHQMELQYGKNTDVAVRSSATAEDLPVASFAGQQETFLNIRGADDVVNAT